MSTLSDGSSHTAMVVTDLDGTLLDSSGRLSAGNRATLVELGARDVLRVVATGRNLHSARTAISSDVPIDYLVFGSGAGTMSWPDGELLNACHLDAEMAAQAACRLMALGFDFMLHQGVPDNHCFWYHRNACGNADFERRVARYKDYCRPLPSGWPQNSAAIVAEGIVAEGIVAEGIVAEDGAPGLAGPFSQLLAVQSTGGAVEFDVQHEQLRSQLAPLHVIRATSPLDHCSAWFEVFADGVSKATGAQWLLSRYDLPQGAVLAVGNDYNDEDMLSWAAHAAVVGNAPAALQARYRTCGSNDADGFSEAVRSWLAEHVDQP